VAAIWRQFEGIAFFAIRPEIGLWFRCVVNRGRIAFLRLARSSPRRPVLLDRFEMYKVFPSRQFFRSDGAMAGFATPPDRNRPLCHRPANGAKRQRAAQSSPYLRANLIAGSKAKLTGD